jgi:hypothetical protein
MPQRLKAAFGRPSGYRIFQVQQKRRWFSHPTSSIYLENTYRVRWNTTPLDDLKIKKGESPTAIPVIILTKC